jgi:hypothetical protein
MHPSDSQENIETLTLKNIMRKISKKVFHDLFMENEVKKFNKTHFKKMIEDKVKVFLGDKYIDWDKTNVKQAFEQLKKSLLSNTTIPKLTQKKHRKNLKKRFINRDFINGLLTPSATSETIDGKTQNYNEESEALQNKNPIQNIKVLDEEAYIKESIRDLLEKYVIIP